MSEFNGQQSIRRGDVWMALLQPSGEYMLRGLHPVLIVSNWKACNKSELLQIIPISSKKKSLPVHVEIEDCGLDHRSILLVEQLTTINRQNLKYQVGKISLKLMLEVQQKVNLQLGFENVYHLDMFQKLKEMLDELQELDRYLQTEYSNEISNEREMLLKDIQRFCINHSIQIDLEKFNIGYSSRYAKEVNA